jgi:hypothetical protein
MKRAMRVRSGRAGTGGGVGGRCPGGSVYALSPKRAISPHMKWNNSFFMLLKEQSHKKNIL